MNQAFVPVVAVLNGSVLGRAQAPSLPLTAAELAEEARRCAEAGATYVVVSARDPSGRPSRDPGAIRETFAAVKAASGLLVAGSLLDFDASLAARQAIVQGRADLLEIPIGGPRLARFDAAAATFGPDRVMALSRSELSGLALDAQERGTWPIALATDLLDLAAVPSLLELEFLSPAAPVAVELDASDSDGLLALRHRLSSLRWALGARGVGAWRTLGLAASLGGGLRVGFEYGQRLPNGEVVTSNAALVEAAVRLLRAIGTEPEASNDLRAAIAA